MKVLLALSAFGAVKPGDPASAIHLQSFIPGQPIDPAIASLKGKAIVLEFWATWRPAQLQVSNIEDLAAGRPPKLPVMPDVSVSRADDGAPLAVCST